jgi:hypothetical protein
VFKIFVSLPLTILLNIKSKKKAGRPLKDLIYNLQLYILHLLTLARFLICPFIQSWHLFRKSKQERVYKILREYWLRRIMVLEKKESL